MKPSGSSGTDEEEEEEAASSCILFSSFTLELRVSPSSSTGGAAVSPLPFLSSATWRKDYILRSK